MFTPSDLQHIQNHGLDAASVEEQLVRFRKGFQHVKLVRPAKVGEGIVRQSELDLKAAVSTWNADGPEWRPVKFVPASGAATRMFKNLLEYRETGVETEFIATFFGQLEQFAFYPTLQATGVDLNDRNAVLSALLDEDGMAYASLPKALLDFHTDEHGARTPMEEHLAEAAQYATDWEGVSRVHFTVSPQHREAVEARLESLRAKCEERYGVRYEFSFSQQNPATDTVAVTPNNELYRAPDGSLLFRPAGHGALLENLQVPEGGIVFVKNIDNVVPERHIASTIEYKKALGGIMLNLQRMAAQIVLTAPMFAGNPAQLADLAEKANRYLGLNLPLDCDAATLVDAVNRPIRVCGMVPNTGEPGGGPFWVEDSNGNVALQIVEKAQINVDDAEQRAILEQATHFNPVDLVCMVRDVHGKPFYLPDFRDDEQFFITEKSHNGNDIKALELPGLWNGGMAGWLTVFVEVPLETFNPVKTVNDLLKPAHQG